MRTRPLPFLLLAALLLPAAAPAQFIQRTTCYRTSGSVDVDGRLDEPEWRLTERLGPFLETESGTQTRYLTFGRLLWDDEYLYVAVEAQDADIWATLTRRDGRLWTEEVLEVFVDPDGDGRDYLEWEINPLGTVLDIHMVQSYADGGPAKTRWNAETVRAAVYVEGTVEDRADRDRRWSAEWAIPWEVVAPFGNGRVVPPTDGDQWRLGLYRTDRTASGDAENSAWSPTRNPSFHTPARFGAVLFSRQEVGERAVLALDGAAVLDSSGSGNGNGLPDPGEEVAVSFTLTNYGRTPAEGLVGVLRSFTPAASVGDSVADLGALGPGKRLPVTGFRVRIDEAYEAQSPLPLVLTVTDGAGHVWLEGLDLYLDAITSRLVLLSGTVRDVDDNPTPGSTVTAWNREGSYSAVTDEAGRYAMEIPEGSYQIEIVPPADLPLGTTELGETMELTGDRELDLVVRRTIVLSGQVTDTDGNPIAGIAVMVWGSSEGEFQNWDTTTDEDGRYRLNLPSLSYYSLALEPGASGLGRWRSSSVRGLVEDAVIDVALDPTHTLSGVVRDSQGSPVTGMYIQAEAEDGGYFGWAQVGSDGSYSLELPSGSYTLDIRSRGTATTPPSQEITGVVVDGDTSRDLALEDGVQVSVELVGPEGEPIGDTFVYLFDSSTGMGDGGQTDADGMMEISLLPGDYRLNVYSPPEPYVGHADEGIAVLADTTITIVLQRGFVVRGRLLDDQGKAHGGYLFFHPLQGQETAFARSQEGGEYTISIAPGWYRVVVQSEGDGRASYPFQELGEVEVVADTTLDLTLDLGLPVPGRLLGASGDPAGGVMLGAMHPELGWSGVATSDANGEFVMNLLPGPYDFIAWFEDGKLLRVGSGTAPSAQPLELRLPGGGTVTGRVLGGEGCSVQALPASRGPPRAFGYSFFAASARADADGRYRLEVEPGRYHIVALPAGSGPVFGSGTGTVVTDVDVSGEVALDLTLPSGQMVILAGSVTGEDGRPASAALVQFYDPDAGVMSLGYTDTGGGYGLSLPPGEYRVTVALSGPFGGVQAVYDMGVLEIAGDRQWDIRLADAVSAVEEQAFLPGAFALEANYPNPFNPATTIEYDLAATVSVELTIHNSLGQRVRRLVAVTQAGGHYAAIWDGRDDAGRSAGSGVYFYALRAGDTFTRVRPMLLLR